MEIIVKLVMWVVGMAILWAVLMVTYVIVGKLIAWTIGGIIGAIDLISGGPRHIAESVARAWHVAWGAIVGLVLTALAGLLRLVTRRHPLDVPGAPRRR